MLDERICRVIAENGQLAVDPASITEDTDLYRAGMSSLSTVNVMMALEEEFSVEFPNDMLQARTFQCLASIRSALEQLTSKGG
jgi:acyl carrier protein